MGKLHVMNHPLITHKITKLRDINTNMKDFREIVEEIATLVFYEATRETSLSTVEVETPNGVFECGTSSVDFGIIPILRAGIGMVNGIHDMMPNAKVGHIGLYRDEETLEPVEYFCKLPANVEELEIFLIDPMLATGGTAVDAIKMLKQKGVTNIKFLCLISCPEGVARVQREHPDVDIYTASHDEKLNEKGYIIPGLGDAGDRLFGTK